MVDDLSVVIWLMISVCIFSFYYCIFYRLYRIETLALILLSAIINYFNLFSSYFSFSILFMSCIMFFCFFLSFSFISSMICFTFRLDAIT